MKNTITLCLLLVNLFFSTNIFAQKNWQQKNDYKIDVRLDDRQQVLLGNIQIVYTNNSPNTLDFIYFHLFIFTFEL